MLIPCYCLLAATTHCYEGARKHDMKALSVYSIKMKIMADYVSQPYTLKPIIKTYHLCLNDRY